MQKNSTKIALGLAVLAIWGTVFYRIYEAVVPSEEFIVPQSSFVPSANNSITPDTFSLLANYQDPFLGNQASQSLFSATRSTRPSVVAAPTKVKPKKSVQFPKVIFKGYVENKGVKTLLLNVEGKNKHLRPGQTLDGLRVTRAYEDSVSLSFKGDRQTFLRE